MLLLLVVAVVVVILIWNANHSCPLWLLCLPMALPGGTTTTVVAAVSRGQTLCASILIYPALYKPANSKHSPLPVAHMSPLVKVHQMTDQTREPPRPPPSAAAKTACWHCRRALLARLLNSPDKIKHSETCIEKSESEVW